MNGDTLASTLTLAFGSALAGLAFGLAYFRALAGTIKLFVSGRGWFGPAGLTLARIVGAIVILIFMARLGAMPLLVGFLGFLSARMIALASVRRVG